MEFRNYVETLRKRWTTVVVVLVVCVPASIGITFVIAPTYEADTLLFDDGQIVGGQRAFDLRVAGYRDLWQRLEAQGTKVVVIADSPAPDRNIPDCVADNPTSLTRCAFDRAASNRAAGTSLVEAAKADPAVTLVDLGDALCPTERCAPVIGGVLVWRDNNHISGTYAATLAPRLDAQLPRLP